MDNTQVGQVSHHPERAGYQILWCARVAVFRQFLHLRI